MKRLESCPVCGYRKIWPYSFTVNEEREDALHFSQSYCKKCDLVFSNPMADREELYRFYVAHYYEEIEQVYNVKFPDIESLILKRVVGEKEGLKRIVIPYVTSGNFFEIGAAYGSLLKAAEEIGFSVYGIEPSESAARFARERLGLKNLKQGLFDPADWPAEFFDVIYSHHVIEHVPDLEEFVGGMYKMLKPGGFAMMATENHHNSWVIYRRIRSYFKGRMLPEFQTADHHTFYFSDKSLCYLLKRHGFEIIKVWVYTHSLEEKLKKAHFRSIFSKAFFYFMHYADVLTGCGNRLFIWCRKPCHG